MDNNQDIPTLGELVNQKTRKKTTQRYQSNHFLGGFGIDIGDEDGTSYGGSKYVFVPVDQYTTNTFTYGMQESSGADICEAL